LISETAAEHSDTPVHKTFPPAGGLAPLTWGPQIDSSALLQSSPEAQPGVGKAAQRVTGQRTKLAISAIVRLLKRLKAGGGETLRKVQIRQMVFRSRVAWVRSEHGHERTSEEREGRFGSRSARGGGDRDRSGLGESLACQRCFK
jgi:hypothetical protein